MKAGTDDQEIFDAAHALWTSGQSREAVGLLEPLSRRHPDHPGVYSALGVCLYESGNLVAARPALEQALALDPEQGVAAYNLAHVLLTLGEEERGLALYERRWSSFIRPAWHPPLDLAWDGEIFDGTLLVLAEQGFGDMIQFARYLPLAAQRCNKLIVVAPPELRSLLAGVPGVAFVVTSGEALPDFDRFVMMMSLAYRLGVFAANRPRPPYLPALRKPALEGTGIKIGLCWSGRTEGRHQKPRAVALAELGRHLYKFQGVTFYSLQLGEARREKQDWAGPAPLIDLADGISDFADTAAYLEQLDLLITVDTAVAHLAGALSRPAFVLVPALAHWVWGLEEAATGWYPSLTLFRATEEGWRDAFINLSRTLSERVDS